MEEPFAAGLIRGTLHRPEQESGDAIVLAHGTGSNSNAPLLVKLARAFSSSQTVGQRDHHPHGVS